MTDTTMPVVELPRPASFPSHRLRVRGAAGAAARSPNEPVADGGGLPVRS